MTNGCNILVAIPKERDQLKELGVNGKGIVCEGVKWIYLAQNSDQCRPGVSMFKFSDSVRGFQFIDSLNDHCQLPKRGCDT
jgi:hypothetical protein